MAGYARIGLQLGFQTRLIVANVDKISTVGIANIPALVNAKIKEPAKLQIFPLLIANADLIISEINVSIRAKINVIMAANVR